MASSLTTASPRSSRGDDESMLGRKRELKALPTSFSSNLGRDFKAPLPHSPPPPPLCPRNASANTSQSGGRSVKSIVAWLESSPTTGVFADRTGSRTKKRRQRPTDEEVPHNDSSTAQHSTTASLSTQFSQQSLGAPDVEEYSLTLLKYREYFTERPLARCLDDEEGAGQGRASRPVTVIRNCSQQVSSVDNESSSDASPQSTAVRDRHGYQEVRRNSALRPILYADW
jgi:hypothetical protein